MLCGFVGSVPVVAVETATNLPPVVASNLKSCKSLLPLEPFEPELITARNCFVLSLVNAIGNCPPELKGDPEIGVSWPEAAVSGKPLMLLLPLSFGVFFDHQNAPWGHQLLNDSVGSCQSAGRSPT
jgi:hypothetical protein